MLEEKYFKEDIKIFEKSLNERLNTKLLKLENELFSISEKSPKIYNILLDKNKFDFSYILTEIVEEEKINLNSEYLESVYLDCDYYDLEKFENKIYTGYFFIDEVKYNFRYILEKDNRYEKEIEKLYKLFITNNIKWYGINMKYINRMYRVKIVEYIDDISVIDKIEPIYIEYNFEDRVKINLKPYWNIVNQKFVVKESLTILDSFAYKYELDKNENCTYLVNEKDELIEDVINMEKKLEVYSKFSNLYSFNILIIKNLNINIFKDIVANYDYEISSEPNIENIKKYFKKNNIEIKTIKKVEKINNNLNIPNYNKMILKKIIAYIEVKLASHYDYDKVFNIVNILNLNLYMYEVVIYE